MPDWLTVLDSTKHGPRPTLTNAVRVLHEDPTLGPHYLWYDTFLDRILTQRSPVREWTDEDDTELTVYMQEHAGIATLADAVVRKAVQLVAHQRTKHVIKDWLNGLTWDGEPRLDAALETYWGAPVTEAQPLSYLRAVSRNFLLGMVARVGRPGCQLDHMPVFEGAQGIGKTTALRILGGAWYALAHESVTKKDFFEGLSGKWLVEIGELDAFSRAEVTRVKTVVSTPVDRYRASYGRHAGDHPRQCVFAGTTNADDWGTDDTGLRRFWPVTCGRIDLDGLARDRDQLFSEALFRHRLPGTTWWEMPSSTGTVQAGRYSDHAWDTVIIQGLAFCEETTLLDVLTRIMKFNPNEITRLHELQVGSTLRRAGWVKRNRRVDGVQGKRWFAPES